MQLTHKLQPKYKFGQRVRITTEFYGTLEGTVEAVAEQRKWIFWPFKSQHYLLYQVSALVDGVEYLVVVDESLIKPVADLRPVRGK